METYTTAQAAELTGTSVRALRKRIERGTLRAVRAKGGWRIPRSELERAGLPIGPPVSSTEMVRELTDALRRQERELQELRALPERIKVERARLADAERELATLRVLPERFEAERARVDAAEQRAAESESEAAELRAELEQIAAAGPIQALKLRRRLRTKRSAAV